jgi:hypothetical protein
MTSVSITQTLLCVPQELVADRREDLGARQCPGQERIDEGPIVIRQLGQGSLISTAMARRAASGLSNVSSWNGSGSRNGRTVTAAAGRDMTTPSSPVTAARGLSASAATCTVRISRRDFRCLR